MNASGTSGGPARLVIDSAGKVRGSMTDSVWTQNNPTATPRMGTVTGQCGPGQDLALTVTWTGGAVATYAGTWSHPTPASLGANLSATNPKSGTNADKLALALHEQGVAGTPPYGVPMQTFTPDFQKQWTGTWTINWFDGGADWGTGTVRVASDGVINGSMVDDGFNSTQWNQAVSATIAGNIAANGATQATVTWSDGRPAWLMVGKAFFTNPEQFQLNFTPANQNQTAANSITMTFMRGQ